MLSSAVLIALASVQAAPPAAGLTFTAPSAWKSRPPASSMRVAEFVVPKTGGDPEDAEAIVYFFGGSGGTVEANIDRWIGQMQQPDGSASKDKARRDTQTINGLKVTTVDVAGTYVAEVRPGATERYNKPEFRLRAAARDQRPPESDQRLLNVWIFCSQCCVTAGSHGGHLITLQEQTAKIEFIL